MKTFYADVKYSKEFMQALMNKRRAYALGTVIITTDGRRIERRRGGFEMA
jgi:hypothetical protein